MGKGTDKNLRDYGLPDTGEPTGPPTWEKAPSRGEIEPICPNCKGWLCDISVPVTNSLLKGGKGIARYLGCPACPYASPSVVVAT